RLMIGRCPISPTLNPTVDAGYRRINKCVNIMAIVPFQMNWPSSCHHLPPIFMQILGTGTDIVECLRIARMIDRHGELFISRVYTDAEIEYCSTRKAATQHYAGRWAAKEAVLKALGTGWRRGLRRGHAQKRTTPTRGP